MSPQLFTLAEVAALLGVSRSKVHDLGRQGLLDLRQLGARTTRVTSVSVQNLIDHPELVGAPDKVAPAMTRRLSPADAATFCGLSSGRLAKLRMTGDGPRYIKIGKRVVYDVADIERWLEANKYLSTAQTTKQTASS